LIGVRAERGPEEDECEDGDCFTRDEAIDNNGSIVWVVGIKPGWGDVTVCHGGLESEEKNNLLLLDYLVAKYVGLAYAS
jgi:hypothetical protein